MGFFSKWKKDSGAAAAVIDTVPESAPLKDSADKFETILKSWRKRILEISSELMAVSKETEDEFLSVGMKLQTFSKHCAENSSQATSIVTLIESGSGFNADAFKELFEYAHSKVEDCGATISNGIAGMKDLDVRISEIFALQEFLKKLSHSISIIGTLMKIETARVGEDEFTIMTAVVDELSQEIDRDNIEIGSLAKTAKAILSASIGKMLQEANEFTGELKSSKERVSGILEEMDRMILMAKQACKRIDGRTSQITPLVGNVISALQYHDICRQQMEHVSSALNDLVSRINSMSAMEDNEKISFCCWAVEAIGIQVQQLESVISKTVSAAEGISSSLSSISDLAGAQAEDAGIILEEEDSGSHRIANIGAELNNLSGMLEKTKTVAMDMTEAVSEVNNSIGGMSKQVSNIEMISENINLLALNTILKVARTGDAGRGLEVLAGEIRKLSASAKNEITKGSRVIGEILNASSEYRAKVAEDLKAELIETDQVFNKTDEAVQELLKIDENLSKTLNAISTATQELSTEISQLIAGLRFDSVIKSSLGKTASDLRGLSAELGGDTSGMPCESIKASSPELRELSERYTMHSEREVHEAALASAKKNGNGSSGASTAAGSELGDNVELF